jgi:hypothetical protein
LALFQSAGTVHVWLDPSATAFAAGAATAMAADVPVIDALTVSVAVTVHVPVLSVTENTP